MTLAEHLPPRDLSGAPDADALFDAFESWTAERGLRLYPAQEEALLEVMTGANLILSTPTGSGKSLVATGAHFAALAANRRTYYTAPIKALVSEKFFALCDIFGASRVGMLTGDSAVNRDAPIICCTAEVLATGRGRSGGDGRVPLLLRARSWLGLAGAPAQPSPGPVRADVSHPR
jgi:superfamily II RNA helicase